MKETDKYILKRLKTTVLICDEPYPNSGRVYPKTVINEALQDKLLQQQLKYHTLFGDIETKDNYGNPEIDVSKVAFSTEKLYWYRNELRAEIVILDTPEGRVLADLYKKAPNERKFTIVGHGEFKDKICTKHEIGKLTYVIQR